MHKSYFPMLDASGIILSLFYITLLSFVLIYISKLMKTGFSSKSIVSMYLYYYLFFIVGTFISFIPDMPDSALFASMITENIYPDHQSVGVRLFYVISYPLRIFSLFKIEVFILFQLFIFMLSLMVLWKSWQIVLKHHHEDTHRGMRLFLILSSIYPAFLLYMPVPLREFLVLFGFSVMVYGLVNLFYNRRGILKILMGAILLIFARPQLVVIVVIFLAVFQRNIWLRYISILGMFVVVPWAFSSLMSYPFSPQFFSYLRYELITTYKELSYGLVEWKTYLDMLIDLPALVLQFLLSPFPILHDKNPLNFLSIFIDALFSIGIYISVLYAGIKMSKVYLFIFLVSAILFSIWEFYIPGAVRHRMPLVAILLPVASYGMMKFYDRLRGK